MAGRIQLSVALPAEAILQQALFVSQVTALPFGLFPSSHKRWESGSLILCSLFFFTVRI